MIMAKPSTKKEVQRLTGRIAALNRFISKLAECSLRFFKALRGGDKVEWGLEQSEPFMQLKNYMVTMLMVTIPDPEASLPLYVAASNHAISRVLAHKKEEGTKVVQRLVYFVSKALSGAKLNYMEIEKITHAILISSRKLKHYFQGHEITVPTSQPLGDILKSKEASGRIGKWAIELSQFEITYVPRIAIKSQALTDFMVDWTPLAQNTPQPSNQAWVIFIDGAWR
jgi:hypothetical protein